MISIQTNQFTLKHNNRKQNHNNQVYCCWQISFISKVLMWSADRVLHIAMFLFVCLFYQYMEWWLSMCVWGVGGGGGGLSHPAKAGLQTCSSSTGLAPLWPQVLHIMPHTTTTTKKKDYCYDLLDREGEMWWGRTGGMLCTDTQPAYVTAASAEHFRIPRLCQEEPYCFETEPKCHFLRNDLVELWAFVFVTRQLACSSTDGVYAIHTGRKAAGSRGHKVTGSARWREETGLISERLAASCAKWRVHRGHCLSSGYTSNSTT